MIIACPSCSSPYQLRDQDVAPLVQVECPSCDSRVILDFEAANDPTLVEAGTQSTNAYADEAAYLSHGRAPVEAPTPAARASQPAIDSAATPRPVAPKPARPSSRPVVAEEHQPKPMDEPVLIEQLVGDEPTSGRRRHVGRSETSGLGPGHQEAPAMGREEQPLGRRAQHRPTGTIHRQARWRIIIGIPGLWYPWSVFGIVCSKFNFKAYPFA